MIEKHQLWIDCAGKGDHSEVLDQGVQHARSPVVFFADADIVGLTHEMIDQTVEPVADGACEMFILMRNRKIYLCPTPAGSCCQNGSSSGSAAARNACRDSNGTRHGWTAGSVHDPTGRCCSASSSTAHGSCRSHTCPPAPSASAASSGSTPSGPRCGGFAATIVVAVAVRVVTGWRRLRPAAL